MATKRDDLRRACMSGDIEACKVMRDTPGFAEGGLMADASRLWKMEAQYPEFEKGITKKGVVPTSQPEEQYMYSPIQRGYAEGGSVYDIEGSILAPEEPLNFDEEMPTEMLMMEEEAELGLSPEDTEILRQAMSDYPELEGILNTISAVSGDEFTGDGTVEGAGTGTSDSINAKLSDGEFVFTAKAVKQLGVDKLRKMMDKAEGEYDESSMKQEYQQMDDTGFAKGGFFTRPNYQHGGMHTEKPQNTKQDSFWGGVGSWIVDKLNKLNEGRQIKSSVVHEIAKQQREQESTATADEQGNEVPWDDGSAGMYTSPDRDSIMVRGTF